MGAPLSADSHATSPECFQESGAPLFVVINPGSGEHEPERTRHVLSGVCGDAGRQVVFAQVKGPGLLFHACANAAAQAASHGGILVAAGGDGTINTAARAALERGCPLGVIPQGTFNYVAREHGIPLELEAAARALLGARARPVQVGLVNGEAFLVNASLGLYPQLLQDREAFKARLGRRRWVAILAGLVTLLQWRRQLLLEVELDGLRTVLKTSTLFIANNRLQVERVGIEERVIDSMALGRLGGVMIRPIGFAAMLGLALRGALGRLGEADQVNSFSFHTLDVNVVGMRGVKVATDGEVRRMLPPLRFSAAAGALRLMVPAQQDRVARE